MSFHLKISNELIESGGRIIVPTGIYEVRLVDFGPKFSKPKATDFNNTPSLNLNARMEVLGHPEFEKPVYIFEGLNENAYWVYPDFCHGFGLPMESDETKSWLPGNWTSRPDFDPEKAETYFIRGRLLVELPR